MAITIQQQPPEYSPLYNGLHFVLTSSNSGAENFSIKSTVVEDAVTLATLNIPVNPAGSIYIDPGRILEQVISDDITPVNTGAAWFKSGTFIKYTSTFQESLGATPAPTGSITTVTQYAFNAALRYFDFTNYNQSTYLVDATDTLQRYLTNMPTSVLVRNSQRVELGMFTEADGLVNPVNRAVIKTYDYQGNLQQTATVNNPYNTYSNDDERFLSFMCGPRDLNSLSLTTGSQPLITDGIQKYTVQIQDDDSDGNTTILQEFILDRSCSRYNDEVVLYFLNPLGRYDSMAFSLANRTTFDYTKSSFRQWPGEVTASTFQYNQFGREMINYDTQEQEKWKLVSDWITEDMAFWLRDLIGSPRVYMTHPDYDDALVEVTVALSTYTPAENAVEHIFNLELDIMLSSVNFRQRL